MSEDDMALIKELNEDANRIVEERLKQRGYVFLTEVLDAIKFNERIGLKNPVVSEWKLEETH